MAGQVSRPKLGLDHACMFLSYSDRLTHQSRLASPMMHCQEGHSHTHWVAPSSTQKCISRTEAPHPICVEVQVPGSARAAPSHASQRVPTYPVIVQGVHVADDLHQVLRADAVDPLLQQKRTKEERSKLQGSVTEASTTLPLSLLQTQPQTETRLAHDSHGKS